MNKDKKSHVGQNEFIAGVEAGKALKESGITNLLFITHEENNKSSTERLNGIKTIVKNTEKLAIREDVKQNIEIIKAYLDNNNNIDGIITFGPLSAEPTLFALRELGLESSIFFGTFDLSETIVSAIKNGEIMFAVDQQPYLQGFLPVVMLQLEIDKKIQMPGKYDSGPIMINSSNITDFNINSE